MAIAPVSGDLVVKLALVAGAALALWYVLEHLPSLGKAATAAGNVTADAATGTVHTAAGGIGSALIGAVDAIGLTPYLKRVSDTDVTPADSSIGPGTAEVNGQLFNGNF